MVCKLDGNPRFNLIIQALSIIKLKCILAQHWFVLCLNKKSVFRGLIILILVKKIKIKIIIIILLLYEYK